VHVNLQRNGMMQLEELQKKEKKFNTTFYITVPYRTVEKNYTIRGDSTHVLRNISDHFIIIIYINNRCNVRTCKSFGSYEIYLHAILYFFISLLVNIKRTLNIIIYIYIWVTRTIGTWSYELIGFTFLTAKAMKVFDGVFFFFKSSTVFSFFLNVDTRVWGFTQSITI